MSLGPDIPDYPQPGALERCLDLLFPPTCMSCGRVGRWICAQCWPAVAWLPPAECVSCRRAWVRVVCPHCSGQGSYLDGLLAVVQFEGAGRESVHALKYEGRHAIAGMMSRLMAGAVPEIPLTAVVPVSLHPKRRRERGYDQAEMLSVKVARLLDLPCLSDGIRRVRPTKQQVTLDAAARRQNVAGAFAASSVVVEGEHILLIDDVYTTGATLDAAAEALRRAGAESVTGLVFASAHGS